MDLWSDDPAERFAAAQELTLTAGWPERIAASAPVTPWPYGMPTPINPFVIFLGPSPGNSPPVGDAAHQRGDPYSLPSVGVAQSGIHVRDGRHYWDRIRDLGTMIIQAHAPGISEIEAHALIGQLNLGTGQFGEAKNAAFESEYCAWVPEVIVDHLRPAYVILLGLGSHLAGSGFDPRFRLAIDWNRPDKAFVFASYQRAKYQFRVWRRQKTDGKNIMLVQWPQHPSRAR